MLLCHIQRKSLGRQAGTMQLLQVFEHKFWKNSIFHFMISLDENVKGSLELLQFIMRRSWLRWGGVHTEQVASFVFYNSHSLIETALNLSDDPLLQSRPQDPVLPWHPCNKREENPLKMSPHCDFTAPRLSCCSCRICQDADSSDPRLQWSYATQRARLWKWHQSIIAPGTVKSCQISNSQDAV